VPAVNVVVVAVKVPLVWPAAIVMLLGTCTKLFVLDKVTNAPPEGAAPFNVTVPTDEFPAVTVLGFMLTDEAASTAGPHWPGTPPPPHVCPGRLQPHVCVPPQPFGVGPQAGPPEHATGTQPLVTVSGCVSGICPVAPSLALIVTVVCLDTEVAA
jgi:hypothetical protein